MVVFYVQCASFCVGHLHGSICAGAEVESCCLSLMSGGEVDLQWSKNTVLGAEVEFCCLSLVAGREVDLQWPKNTNLVYEG